MGTVHRAAAWLDDNRVLGYLLIALVSGVAVGGTGVTFSGETFTQAATSALVTLVVTFLALLCWSYLFRRAGVEI